MLSCTHSQVWAIDWIIVEYKQFSVRIQDPVNVSPLKVQGFSCLISCPGLQPGNGFRCKIPNCDSDNFTFSDFSKDIFPK